MNLAMTSTCEATFSFPYTPTPLIFWNAREDAIVLSLPLWPQGLININVCIFALLHIVRPMDRRRN